MRSVSCQRKVRDSLFPDIFIFYNVCNLIINIAVFAKLFRFIACIFTETVISKSPLQAINMAHISGSDQACTTWPKFNRFLCELTYVYEPHDTLYPLKLAQTSPTSDGLPVGTVRWRNKAPEFLLRRKKTYSKRFVGKQVKLRLALITLNCLACRADCF
jgi:hypothetical protein